MYSIELQENSVLDRPHVAFERCSYVTLAFSCVFELASMLQITAHPVAKS